MSLIHLIAYGESDWILFNDPQWTADNNPRSSTIFHNKYGVKDWVYIKTALESAIEPQRYLRRMMKYPCNIIDILALLSTGLDKEFLRCIDGYDKFIKDVKRLCFGGLDEYLLKDLINIVYSYY